MRTIDFTGHSNERLLASYKFHVTDIGTQTFGEEMRRLYILQEVVAELQRRNCTADMLRISGGDSA